MNNWVKYFQDGSCLVSSNTRPLSWSKTKLDEMVGMEVFDGCMNVELRMGKLKYHYSIEMDVGTDGGEPKIIAYNLQCELRDGKWLVKTYDIVDGRVYTRMASEAV